MVLKEILCYVNVFIIKKLYVKISFIIYNNEFFQYFFLEVFIIGIELLFKKFVFS